MWYHFFFIINSSSKSYYLWPTSIQWCNLEFQSIIPYYKGISLSFKVMYLRVSTLQTMVCGVYGVSIFSYARLTSAGEIKSSNYECFTFREGSCHSYIFSAPEPKAQVHYCDHALSVVRPSVCLSVRRPSLTFTFSTSPLKPLNGIQRNLTRSKISTSSTEFVFFGLIRKTRWPPRPLIGWDIFDFSSETAEQN